MYLPALTKGRKLIRAGMSAGTLESRTVWALKAKPGATTKQLHEMVGGDMMDLIFTLHRMFQDNKISTSQSMNSFFHRLKK